MSCIGMIASYPHYKNNPLKYFFPNDIRYCKASCSLIPQIKQENEYIIRCATNRNNISQVHSKFQFLLSCPTQHHVLLYLLPKRGWELRQKLRITIKHECNDVNWLALVYFFVYIHFFWYVHLFGQFKVNDNVFFSFIFISLLTFAPTNIALRAVLGNSALCLFSTERVINDILTYCNTTEYC